MPQTPPFAAMFDSSGCNRNLYQTKEDNCGGLYYHDNNLLSGSLEALIQHLVPNVDYYPDRTYIFTFLLSSRLFMHPYELMAKVCHLCIEQQRLSEPGLDKNWTQKIAPKILQLLTEWTETFPYDFRDERMMRNLKELAQRITSGDEVSCLHTKLLDKEAFVKAFTALTVLLITWCGSGCLRKFIMKVLVGKKFCLYLSLGQNHKASADLFQSNG
uniref:RasGEF domain family member 1B n=1 Tax=Corvus moneduloides TaxID=1196302 RepID=A0A8U7MAA2_CORMO